MREIFDLKGLYEDIESMDNKASALSQIEALDNIAAFIDYATTWFLKHYRIENLKEDGLLETGERYKKGVGNILA